MSLVELIVSAAVFTASASSSLQLWSATSRWSLGSEHQLQALQQLDQELLAVEATLQSWAGRQQAEEPLRADCSLIAGLLPTTTTARPDALEGSAVQVTLRQAGNEGRFLVRAELPGLGLSRERQLDPAAYGLCGGENADHDAGAPALEAEEL
ncbi:hypothetical protein [Cyanobium sp. NS01]|uniref:hypothetical protein n=1 Tax=Cyanobium sp. NS01 TaxID=261284 RepID=UPI0016464AF1|nr:hypothetical protein [Cyanobium sp. NS01]QNI71432.1 putative conserved secreted protein [Cyanobium sp. NS01]